MSTIINRFRQNQQNRGTASPSDLSPQRNRIPPASLTLTRSGSQPISRPLFVSDEDLSNSDDYFDPDSSTPNANLRKRRFNNDDEDTNDDGSPLPGDLHRAQPTGILSSAYRKFGLDKGRRMGLDEAEVAEFLSLPSECRIIDLKLELLHMRKTQKAITLTASVQQSIGTGVLRDSLALVLSRPDARAYVTNVAENIFAVVKKSPTLFGIPPEAPTNPTLWKSTKKEIREDLTGLRSAMRTQLDNSHKAFKEDPPRPMSVTVLSKILFPRVENPSPAHFARTAFLRACFVDHQAILANNGIVPTAPSAAEADSNPLSETSATPNGSSNNNPAPGDGRVWGSGSFWAYVDYQLAALRDEIKNAYPTQEERDRALTREFTAILQADMQQYRDDVEHEPIGPVETQSADSSMNWEAALESAVSGQL